jgi:hypothetical protein
MPYLRVRLLHNVQVVLAGLVSEPARACVNHDGDLPNLGDAHRFGSFRVVDFVHHLDFEEVVAATERAELVFAALDGFLGNHIGIGHIEPAVRFGMRKVVFPAVAVFDHPVRAFEHDLAQVGAAGLDETLTAEACGHIAEDLVEQLFQARAYLLFSEVGAQQANPTIDIVPNPPRRNDAFLHVHRRHATDREAVAPVDVGHRNRVAHDAWQKRHIRHLLRRLVLLDLLNHRLAGEDETVHAHARLVAFRNAPAVLVDLLQRTLPHLAHGDLPRRVYL